jgi:hypothetical protein
VGSEIAIPVLGPIILSFSSPLVFVALRYRRFPAPATSFVGLGRSRTAFGYIGSLIACIPISVWAAKDDVNFQVGHHYLTAVQAERRFSDWALEFYFIQASITVVVITVVGLPALAVLRRIRLASVLGTIAVGLPASLVLSYCSHEPPGEFLAIWLLVIAGFDLGARLPLNFRPPIKLGLLKPDTDR